jgi:hypothetical protein
MESLKLLVLGMLVDLVGLAIIGAYTFIQKIRDID